MNYLMDQSVMNFAGSAARGSAIGTALSEGMVSYLADTDSLDVYRAIGTASPSWQPVAFESYVDAKPVSGLVPIIPPTVNFSGGTATANSLGTIEFTSVTSISVNDAFSSSYQDYLLIYEINSSTSSQALIRLRKSGTDASTSAYEATRIFQTNSTGGFQDTGAGSNYGLTPENAQKFYGQLDMRKPFVSKHTHIYGTNIYNTSDTSATSMGQQLSVIQHRVVESYDGVTISMLGGNMTGTLTVYGRNS
jgi:hypothetical protein